MYKNIVLRSCCKVLKKYKIKFNVKKYVKFRQNFRGGRPAGQQRLDENSDNTKSYSV